jgi:hypothetical protein
MWSHLLPRNLLDFQRQAAIKALDDQIAKDHAAGYGTDVNALLDRRLQLMNLLRQGPTA